ncbi:hypothetical protein N7478_011561 [Penicillium angulare]|uniref:uncharacterized protein n=1 Tax=Penicillium angulare TaxID=116970 RepID=UPI002541FD14|nr:uncharacterized protein N7478_011561 [Penicillium angulare]KAJ5263956.1 hypothetical protein N7478_011561 [Penicillium angulare]
MYLEIALESPYFPINSMTSKILIVNSTVCDGRILISFSYPPLAQFYKEYLETSENSCDDKHQWGVAISGRQVSMNLPPGITFEFPGDSKDAILVFEDETMAVKWEEKMILWEKCENQEGSKRSISRSLTVGQLIEKLSLPEQTFRLRQVNGATSQSIGHMSDSLIRQFRGTGN